MWLRRLWHHFQLAQEKKTTDEGNKKEKKITEKKRESHMVNGTSKTNQVLRQISHQCLVARTTNHWYQTLRISSLLNARIRPGRIWTVLKFWMVQPSWKFLRSILGYNFSLQVSMCHILKISSWQPLFFAKDAFLKSINELSKCTNRRDIQTIFCWSHL